MSVALYAPKGTVVLFAAAALIGLYSLVVERKSPASFFHGPALPVAALAIWGVASLGWTVSSDASWPLVRSLPFGMLGGIVLVFAAGRLGSGDRAFVGRLTVAGFGLGALLAIADIASGFKISLALHIAKYGGEWSAVIPGFVINNGVTVMVLLIWPVCIFLFTRNRRRVALAGFAAVVAISGLSSSFAAVAAILVGLLAFLTALIARRSIHMIISAGITVLILGSPFAMKALPDARSIGENLPELSYSVYPRLVIWQYASNLVMQKPIVGHGIRTSRALNTETGPIWFVYRDKGKVEKGNTKAIPLHPHNGFIQLWLELGGIGALIGLAIVLSVLRSIKNSTSPPTVKAFMYGALISSLSLISVSYGLWQNWWMGALWLQGALIVASRGPAPERNR